VFDVALDVIVVIGNTEIIQTDRPAKGDDLADGIVGGLFAMAGNAYGVRLLTRLPLVRPAMGGRGPGSVGAQGLIWVGACGFAARAVIARRTDRIHFCVLMYLVSLKTERIGVRTMHAH